MVSDPRFNNAVLRKRSKIMTGFATGGCLCSSVRYECAKEPLMMGTCHCRDCQRASGSAHATLLIFKKNTVRFLGDEMRTYSTAGGSGKSVKRLFCGTCGSPVTAHYDVTPNFCVVFAGTLDDPSLIKPQWNIYTSHKQSWITLSPNIQSFKEGYGSDG